MFHAAQAPIIWLNAQDIMSQRFIVSLTLPLKIATKTSSDQPSQLLIFILFSTVRNVIRTGPCSDCKCSPLIPGASDMDQMVAGQKITVLVFLNHSLECSVLVCYIYPTPRFNVPLVRCQLNYTVQGN
jgi:hypothetical protein